MTSSYYNFCISQQVNENPPHFIYEINIIAYDIIDVNVLHCKSMRFHRKKAQTMSTILLKPGCHLCDKHKHKHKHKLATFPHVKQAQENMAYASAVTLEEIWKYSRWRMKCLCLSHAGSHL